MRVKLIFDDEVLESYKKIWYYIDETCCKYVMDVCIMLESFFNSKGIIKLFNDGFYLPFEESINVLREDDVLSVVFEEKKDNGKIGSAISNSRKRKPSSSSSSTSSSSEDLTNPPAKKQKKVVPISQLGVSSKIAHKKSFEVKHAPVKENVPTKTKDDNSGKHPKEHQGNLPTGKIQLVNKISILSSDDDSSTSSDSSDSDVQPQKEPELTKDTNSTYVLPAVAQKEIEKNESVNVDFKVSEKGSTSTPFSLPIPKGSVNKRRLSGVFLANTAKSLPANDTYENVSKVYVSPATSSQSADSTLVAMATPSDVKKGDSSADGSVSAKTLRNRRRRQRKAERMRKGTENGESVSKEVPASIPAKTAVEQPSDKLETDAKQTNTSDAKPKDYSLYPALHLPPANGSRIVYQLLEMSMSYTPVSSEHREAIVISYNAEDSTVVLDVKTETKRSRGDGNVTNRFELEEEGEITENEVRLAWKDLINPRLLAPA